MSDESDSYRVPDDDGSLRGASSCRILSDSVGLGGDGQFRALPYLRKGYTDAGVNADFLVRISSGAATQYTSTVMSGSDEDRLQSVTTGEVVVDAFDRSTAQQVWHGAARAEVDPQRINEPELQAAVHQWLAPFPARSVQ